MKKIGCIVLSALLFASSCLFVSCGTEKSEGPAVLEEFVNITF